MQVRVAAIEDAEAIVSVVNAPFRKAEGFLLDRDRINLETVRECSGRERFDGQAMAAVHT